MAVLINAENHVLGRLASEVAQMLLGGEQVTIINAEKVVLSGKETALFKEYKKRMDAGSRYRGPFYSKSPDKIVLKAIKGMLPLNKSGGAAALKRLRVCVGVPSDTDLKSAEKIREASGKKLSGKKHVSVLKLSKRLGAD